MPDEPPAGPPHVLDGRLLQLEAFMRTRSVDERLAVRRWILRLLSRPPFDRPDADALDPVWLFLTLAADDLLDATMDPASPVLPDGSVIPVPHPLAFEPLPDEDEPAHSAAAGPAVSATELAARLGGVFAR